jgi:hypothetical protein
MIQSWRAQHLLKVVALPAVVGLPFMASGGVWRGAEGGTAETGAAGNTLMGKLEGPGVITDPAQFLPSFHEAPIWRSSCRRESCPP